jgi:hypothetical protein
MHRELLDAALNPAQVGRTLPSGLDMVGERHYARFKLLEGSAFVHQAIALVELVGQRVDEPFEMLWHRAHLLDARVERVGQLMNAVRERVEAARPADRREMIDARRKCLHIACDRGDALGRRDAGGKFAQFVDGGFEVAQRFGIGRGGAARKAVHFVRQLRDACLEYAKPFSRRHLVEGSVDLREAVLDVFQCRRIGAAPDALVDPLGERVHVILQRFERAARQRLMDGTGDFGQVGAQGRDRFFDAARTAERFDLGGDVAELPFEACEVRTHRCGGGLLLRGAGCRHRGGVERALACGNLGDEVVDAGFPHGRERRRGGAGGFGGGAVGGELFEAGVEPGDRLGQPVAARCGVGGSRTAHAARKLIEAAADRTGGRAGGRLTKRRIEPLVDRHAGATGCFLRGLVQLGAEPVVIPRGA